MQQPDYQDIDKNPIPVEEKPAPPPIADVEDEVEDQQDEEDEDQEDEFDELEED